MTATSRITTDPSVVVTAVVSRVHQAKISQPVIRFVSVDVMNKLKSFKFSAKVLSHQPSVEIDAFTLSVNDLVSTRISIASAGRRVCSDQTTYNVQSVVTRRAVPSCKQLAATCNTRFWRIQRHMYRALTHILTRCITGNTLWASWRFSELGYSRAFQRIAMSLPSAIVHPTPTSFFGGSPTDETHNISVTPKLVPVHMDALDL